jgi:hypothetical protein
MAKITPEQRNRYFEKVKEYKQMADSALQREKSLADIAEKDVNSGAYKKLALASETLNLFSVYVHINTLSVSLLGVKNEDYLAEARKTLGRSMKYVEDVVTAYLDVPFKDYEKNLEQIADFEPEARYRLLRKFGFSIEALESAYGDNSKWKWSFVEVWGKFAILAKNLLDLKGLPSMMDFDSPHRQVAMAHLGLCKQYCIGAADRYREKYEIFSNKIEDFKMSLLFLSALRRIHMVLGERDDAESLKKKIDIWSAKMENDERKKEEEGKRK